MPANAHTYEIVFSTIIIVIYRVHRCCYFCCAAAFHCRHSFFFVHQSTKTNQIKLLKILCFFVVARCYSFCIQREENGVVNESARDFFIKWAEEEKIKNKKRNKWKEVDNNAADIWRRYKSKHFSKSAKWCYSTSKYLSSNPIRCTKTDERYFV